MILLLMSQSCSNIFYVIIIIIILFQTKMFRSKYKNNKLLMLINDYNKILRWRTFFTMKTFLID